MTELDSDANAIILDRKIIENTLNELHKRLATMQGQHQKIVKDKEILIMNIDRTQGGIEQLTKILQDNPTKNASSLQTGEAPK